MSLGEQYLSAHLPRNRSLTWPTLKRRAGVPSRAIIPKRVQRKKESTRTVEARSPRDGKSTARKLPLLYLPCHFVVTIRARDTSDKNRIHINLPENVDVFSWRFYTWEKLVARIVQRELLPNPRSSVMLRRLRRLRTVSTICTQENGEERKKIKPGRSSR